MRSGINIDNVSFGYDGNEEMIHNVSFGLACGSVTAVVATPGSGKSTLLKLAAGLLRPSSGEVTIAGKQFWGLTDIEKNDIRSRMGFCFQEGALIANMTVFNNLALPLAYHERYDEKGTEKLVNFWIERLGLSKYSNLLPAALSLKLRRRVAFARTLITGQNCFFWDDPTDGVEETFTNLIVNVILEKKSEGTVQLIATADASFLRRVADVVIVLKSGKIAHEGSLIDGKISGDISMEGVLKG